MQVLKTYKENLDGLDKETTNSEIVDFDNATSWWNPFKAFYRRYIAQKMCKKLDNSSEMDNLVNTLKPNDEILDGIEEITKVKNIDELKEVAPPENCPKGYESPVTLFGVLAGTAIGTKLLGFSLPK